MAETEAEIRGATGKTREDARNLTLSPGLTKLQMVLAASMANVLQDLNSSDIGGINEHHLKLTGKADFSPEMNTCNFDEGLVFVHLNLTPSV
ncbi:hypothetical protein JCGZ_01135 [Jatropha curcas]|uniref:Uncharacterized protein n=1 Tax=Jatropha curcas TaxID=180498 RepID=A0A067KWL8_JATCU|nr:hypothetical protein JCGZ_01135 [Jatropha curcas]